MRVDTAARLRCPHGCEGALALTSGKTEKERILDGVLSCPACGQRYPIEEGIARMLPGFLSDDTTVHDDAQRATEVERKRSEMTARDAQVEDYDNMHGLTLYGKLFEIPATLKKLKLGSRHTLLEAGCGTGRMTPTFAAHCDSLIAVDFSLESLRVCKRKLDSAGVSNVDLIQTDICALPFSPDYFDKIVSCGVLEHVPTDESRSKMISELTRVAKVGGDVVISAYKHNLYTRLFGEKEGAHDGDIYFFRYHRHEFQEALAASLEVRGITGKLIYYYMAHCRKTVSV